MIRESEQAIAEYLVVEVKLSNANFAREDRGIQECGMSMTMVPLSSLVNGILNANVIRKNFILKPKYVIKVYNVIFNIDSQIENVVLNVEQVDRRLLDHQWVIPVYGDAR